MYGLTEGAGLDALRARLDLVHLERRDRLIRICERLRRLGIEIDAQTLLVSTHGRTAGRPDVAHALVAGGHVATPQEAFTRYLRDGGPADVPLQRLSVAEGLALGTAAGAKASLAHPHTVGDLTAVRALVRRHRDAGLVGLEAFYGTYAAAQSQQWLTLVRELDLVATGGSDFHGVMNPAVTQPGIELRPDRAQRLCEWLGIAA
jgi:predicted metal-dependent phosphoesterase TrpH